VYESPFLACSIPRYGNSATVPRLRHLLPVALSGEAAATLESSWCPVRHRTVKIRPALSDSLPPRMPISVRYQGDRPSRTSSVAIGGSSPSYGQRPVIGRQLAAAPDCRDRVRGCPAGHPMVELVRD
jgi:hypothetical protein